MPSKSQEKKQDIRREKEKISLRKSKLGRYASLAKICEENYAFYEVTWTNQLIQVCYT